MINNKNLLNVREAGELLNVRPETLAVWRSTKRYAIPYVKIGSRVFYRQEDIDNFIKANVHGEL